MGWNILKEGREEILKENGKIISYRGDYYYQKWIKKLRFVLKNPLYPYDLERMVLIKDNENSLANSLSWK